MNVPNSLTIGLKAALKVAVIALALGVPASAQARTSDWTVSFPPPAVTQRVAQAQAQVVVIPAGAASDDLKAATGALTQALERSDDVAGVRQIDRQAGDDDAALAKAAFDDKTDRALVVRVFEEGDRLEAVVTVFDREGTVLDAFTATPGRPIAAAGAASGGVAVSAAESAAEVSADAELGSDAAQTEYDENFVSFEETYSGTVSGNTVVVSKNLHPVKGKYREPLPHASFYEHVGRDDLASKYKARRGARIGLYAGGATLAAIGTIGGTILMVRGITGADCTNEIGNDAVYDMCNEQAEERTAQGLRQGGILLGVGLGGGLVMMMTAAFIKPHPVDMAEARKLADQYNEGLRERLELPKNVTVSPTAGRQGAGLVLRGRF